jgi:hypothetical protein
MAPFVSLHLGPAFSHSPSSSPVRMRHEVHYRWRVQEAGGRRGGATSSCNVLHAHLSNIDVLSRSFEQNCPTTAHAQADRAITNWEEGSTRSGTLAGRRASSVSQSVSQSINQPLHPFLGSYQDLVVIIAPFPLLRRQSPHQSDQSEIGF